MHSKLTVKNHKSFNIFFKVSNFELAYFCFCPNNTHMKSVAIILSLVSIVLSCSSEPKVVHLRTVKGKKEVAPSIKVNTLLTLEIEGMTCEMGCGGSIRKELKATGGVQRVKYDFQEGRTVQTATISFDNKKVTTKQMINIITKMNENQFTVGKSTEESINNKTSDLTPKSTSRTETCKEDVSVDLSEQKMGLPNIFEILAATV